MQEYEHMGFLSKLIISVIITNEIRKTTFVFHILFSTSVLYVRQTLVEKILQNYLHIIQERKGTRRAECRRIMVKSLTDPEIRHSHHQL